MKKKITTNNDNKKQGDASNKYNKKRMTQKKRERTQTQFERRQNNDQNVRIGNVENLLSSHHSYDSRKKHPTSAPTQSLSVVQHNNDSAFKHKPARSPPSGINFRLWQLMGRTGAFGTIRDETAVAASAWVPLISGDGQPLRSVPAAVSAAAGGC